MPKYQYFGATQSVLYSDSFSESSFPLPKINTLYRPIAVDLKMSHWGTSRGQLERSRQTKWELISSRFFHYMQILVWVNKCNESIGCSFSCPINTEPHGITGRPLPLSIVIKQFINHKLITSLQFANDFKIKALKFLTFVLFFTRDFLFPFAVSARRDKITSFYLCYKLYPMD